jgi:hypothetical protein
MTDLALANLQEALASFAEKDRELKDRRYMYARTHRRKHAEQIKVYGKFYYRKNASPLRGYQQNNAEKVKERRRNHYAKDKGMINLRKRELYQKASR